MWCTIKNDFKFFNRVWFRNLFLKLQVEKQIIEVSKKFPNTNTVIEKLEGNTKEDIVSD